MASNSVCPYEDGKADTVRVQVIHVISQGCSLSVLYQVRGMDQI